MLKVPTHSVSFDGLELRLLSVLSAVQGEAQVRG